jgi:hypothetical protein
MARETTAAEMLAEKRRKMPPDLAELDFRLHQDLVWLNLTWLEYKLLFATSAERVALMNHTAARFFARYEELVWHDTMLGLCRLTDPVKTGPQENATVRRLSALIPNPELAAKVETGSLECVQATEFARNWRNKRLAHRDLQHALNPSENPLLQANRSLVEDALRRLADLLNVIELHYENSTTTFDRIIVYSGAEELLHYLALGRDANQERILAGESPKRGRP